MKLHSKSTIMKNILTILFTLFSLTLLADIPRVDIMEVEYQGKKYYKWEFISHLSFTKGCVFDRHSGEYLYEEAEYFRGRHNGNELKLFKEMVSIPKSKILSHYDPTDEYNSEYLIQLVGDPIKLKEEQLDSLAITKIIVGNTAGYTYSPGLSKLDESWILDYDLEKIVKLNDGELCDLELYSIKGNISKEEKQGIKREIRSLYKAILSNNGYDGKTPDEYFNELLKRNILMIGFCSC